MHSHLSCDLSCDLPYNLLSDRPSDLYLTLPDGLLSLDSMYPVRTSALVAGDVVELASCRRHLHTQHAARQGDQRNASNPNIKAFS